MTLLLGVDTGGTYTDAVLIRDEQDVLATAKSLTTRHDLAIGVGAAVQSVIDAAGVQAGDIHMAALSTTLATNALVEGQGGRVGLVYIGFREADLETHGLADALKGDPVCVLKGGHGHSGQEGDPLDEAGLTAFLETYGDSVSGFAVASRFATRNPAHELRAMAMIAEQSRRPVSASHQLSAKLGGPRRALTALLNARLIGMIDGLIGRAEAQLKDMEVVAPLMVVRGDGALMSAAEARRRPIETILSGPAASLVGARWLTGVQDALVSDIGGTTTDVALLRGGRPALDPEGARVGPYRTMVEAVQMRTFGLGGDSEVHLVAQGLLGGVTLGPHRLVPMSLIAHEAPDVVLPALEQQLLQTLPGEYDTRFARPVPGIGTEGIGERERVLLDRLDGQVQPLSAVLRNRLEQGALKRLVSRGLVQVAGVTPSDAAHVLGLVSVWNTDAAHMALKLFGRRRDGAGNMLAKSSEDLAQIIIDQMTRQTGLTLLETAFAEEGVDVPPAELAQHPLMQMGLQNHSNVIRIEAGLALPVVALGASAGSYYPAVGALLGTDMRVPEHADVANAIGAVVGRVVVRRHGSVTSEGEGRFRVHFDTGPQDFAARDAALDALETELREQATQAAYAAGAVDVEVTPTRKIEEAVIESRSVFIQAEISVEASGRPRLAIDQSPAKP
ncbi:MAG: hydantoinase/oxoprolinase family protein [Paracoccaceae bacterium]